MNKLFKNNFRFYIKTLLIYGILIALLHCPSMQYEQRYDEHTVDAAAENSDGVMTEIEGDEVSKKAYPYARMMNLIEQSRSIESHFRVDVVGFGQHGQERIKTIKALLDQSVKVSQRLQEERGRFSDYIAGNTHKQEKDGVTYSCSKGRCGYSVEDYAAFQSDKAALSQKTRRSKSTRYTAQVLNEYIDRMEFVSDRLSALLERVRLADEVAKADSESKAKEMLESDG